MIHVLAAGHAGVLHGGAWNSSDTIAVVILVIVIIAVWKLWSWISG